MKMFILHEGKSKIKALKYIAKELSKVLETNVELLPNGTYLIDKLHKLSKNDIFDIVNKYLQKIDHYVATIKEADFYTGWIIYIISNFKTEFRNFNNEGFHITTESNVENILINGLTGRKSSIDGVSYPESRIYFWSTKQHWLNLIDRPCELEEKWRNYTLSLLRVDLNGYKAYTDKEFARSAFYIITDKILPERISIIDSHNFKGCYEA